MDGDQTLAEVKRLLQLLPGVQIAWTQKSSEQIRIGMSICNARSLGLLAHLTRQANIPLRVEIDWNCATTHDEPECVRYDLRVPVERGPYEPPSNLELIGGLLARSHKQLGLLKPPDAIRLQQEWLVADE